LNSLWNKNLLLLQKRFPELFSLLKENITQIETCFKNGENPFPFWNIENAKNGSLTVRENSLLLHSGYNPEREAEQAASSFDNTENKDFECAVFLGFGAGYLPCAFCSTHKQKAVVLVEIDPLHFLAALNYFDWESVFQHEKCILAIGCPHQDLIGIVNHFGIKNCVFFCQKNQISHAQNYFDDFQKLIERNKQKEQINSNTLERFASLWLKNNCRNLEKAVLSDGIAIYQNNAKYLDAVVLAAGPSLNTIIPYLAELKKRSILICVDTALRACLKANVEPDFVILIDPQYWAAQHLAGLQAKTSVLITEGAAYPSVFEFKCRKTVVCSSLFPLGQFFESKLGNKGKIDTGGSVATSAWDFAHFIGAQNIYFAGLDLSYPGKNTHIKGSTFEEAAHKVSDRIKTIHTQSSSALFSIKTEEGKNYLGRKVLTDSRMKMFAWWFESRIAAPDAIKTYTFCPQNLAIPGIKVTNVQDFLKAPAKENQRKAFFEKSEKQGFDNLSSSEQKELKERFLQTKQNLCLTLQNLYENAKKGFSICDKALSGKESSMNNVFNQLNQIDSRITESSAKEIISLVFPTERQLEKLFASVSFPSDKIKANIFRSKIIYGELKKAVKNYLDNLGQ